MRTFATRTETRIVEDNFNAEHYSTELLIFWILLLTVFQSRGLTAGNLSGGSIQKYGVGVGWGRGKRRMKLVREFCNSRPIVDF